MLAIYLADLSADSKAIERNLVVADFDQELDATGLDCPMPILRTKKALAGMQSGEVIYITATDPGSVKDFTSFARMTGNELLESREQAALFHFLVRKA